MDIVVAGGNNMAKGGVRGIFVFRLLSSLAGSVVDAASDMEHTDSSIGVMSNWISVCTGVRIRFCDGGCVGIAGEVCDDGVRRTLGVDPGV